MTILKYSAVLKIQSILFVLNTNTLIWPPVFKLELKHYHYMKSHHFLSQLYWKVSHWDPHFMKHPGARKELEAQQGRFTCEHILDLQLFRGCGQRGFDRYWLT